MKIVILFSLFFPLVNSKLFERFENWLSEFKIKYESEHHLYELLQKWGDNDEYIDMVNSNKLGYTLSHNQFSGMNMDEFRQYVSNIGNPIYKKREPSYMSELDYFNMTLPKTINWVSSGAVTPVKDQGQCGSCWSFSTTGALEGAYYIKNAHLVSFSEQQLVDCDNLKNGGRNHGCNGGLMDSAFSWIDKNNGLCDESSYPYVSQDGDVKQSCQKKCNIVYGSDITSYIDVPVSSDTSMMSALMINPVSIAIEADERDFQLYKSGVFTGKCGTNLDHGVLAVGYGTLEGLDYYLVKNSWDTSWGDNGYIMLGRGPQYNNGDGQCGILLEASYPVL